MLVEQLPKTSRTLTALSRDHPGDPNQPIDIDAMSTSEQLLALIHDVLSVANWQRSGGKGKPTMIVPKRPRGKIRPKVEVPEAYVRARLRALGH